MLSQHFLGWRQTRQHAKVDRPHSGGGGDESGETGG